MKIITDILKRRFGIVSIIIVGIVSIAIGILLNARWGITPSIEAETFLKEGSSEKTVSVTLPDFVELSKGLKPAVVNISTSQIVKESPVGPFFRGPFRDFFGDEFFDRFFGELPREEFRTQSLGSGFIINKEGFIITNNHVIENADEIIVILASGEEYPAKVIGKDERTDIALIKIEPKKELPVVTIGDSDRLEVGEWVVAIGNPFGLGHTVTAGIVSAKGRVIGAGPYDDFIQTDASINPGNSGGPLFNIRGEVVGINTAIISGGQGIGFAIPINIAKTVVSQLKEKGRVVRGWLGVSIQEVTPELAKSFGLKERKGALVSAVSKGDPAEKAGIKEGDIIVEFDGKEIVDYRSLSRIVAATPPGKEVSIKVIRNGRELTLKAVLGELREDVQAFRERGVEEEKLGLKVKEITPEIARRMGLEGTEGLIVAQVLPGSAADKAGIRRYDIIKEVNRKPIKGIRDYKDAIEKIEKGDVILFRIVRGRSSLYIAVKLGE